MAITKFQDKTVKEWAKQLGISPQGLRTRMGKMGSLEAAVSSGGGHMNRKLTKSDNKLHSNKAPNIIFSTEQLTGKTPATRVNAKRCKVRTNLQQRLDDMEEQRLLKELEVA